ncbi:MAG: YicC family protein [Cyclobacteriaceae bacterium]|nr:YicC family protein [Cyclobacteriaceae bacterium HetDA_MAG_MS6]
MIRSMTGYGAAERVTEDYSLKVEIKTLNSKFFDTIIKLPRELGDKELEVKALLERELKRGKVSFSLEFIPKSYEEVPIEVNQKLFQQYYNEYSKLATVADADTSDLFKLALHSPNVIISKEDQGSVLDWSIFLEVIGEAVEKCTKFRVQEGEKLESFFRSYLTIIENQLNEIEQIDPKRAESIKARLESALSEIREKTSVDENRFEQELIYYLEKIDITEEKVRLGSHLDYFKNVLDDDAGGKKLSFLAQELGREINTIGSKANHAVMQRCVVKMKEELEKIKEQVLNVL